MKENVRKELDALETMLGNWKANHLSFATSDGNNDFLVEEFQDEITTYISPYVRRLFECNYLTAEEAEEFLNYCFNQVDELRLKIYDLENPPGKPGILEKFIDNTRRVLQR
ncbi:MAG: hypothetical protein ACOC6L_03080 [Thermodesulfobacteriota bacterium]